LKKRISSIDIKSNSQSGSYLDGLIEGDNICLFTFCAALSGIGTPKGFGLQKEDKKSKNIYLRLLLFLRRPIYH
jgi:hypothetical protein